MALTVSSVGAALCLLLALAHLIEAASVPSSTSRFRALKLKKSRRTFPTVPMPTVGIEMEWGSIKLALIDPASGDMLGVGDISQGDGLYVTDPKHNNGPGNSIPLLQITRDIDYQSRTATTEMVTGAFRARTNSLLRAVKAMQLFAEVASTKCTAEGKTIKPDTGAVGDDYLKIGTSNTLVKSGNFPNKKTMKFLPLSDVVTAYNTEINKQSDVMKRYALTLANPLPSGIGTKTLYIGVYVSQDGNDEILDNEPQVNYAVKLSTLWNAADKIWKSSYPVPIRTHCKSTIPGWLKERKYVKDFKDQADVQGFFLLMCMKINMLSHESAITDAGSHNAKSLWVSLPKTWASDVLRMIKDEKARAAIFKWWDRKDPDQHAEKRGEELCYGQDKTKKGYQADEAKKSWSFDKCKDLIANRLSWVFAINDYTKERYLGETDKTYGYGLKPNPGKIIYKTTPKPDGAPNYIEAMSWSQTLKPLGGFSIGDDPALVLELRDRPMSQELELMWVRRKVAPSPAAWKTDITEDKMRQLVNYIREVNEMKAETKDEPDEND